jgi:actin-like ATPase involved in cell morphogenesis
VITPRSTTPQLSAALPQVGWLNGLALDSAHGNLVVLIHAGTAQTVLTSSDGLSNPTSVKISGSPVYVTSAAYFTK